MTNYWRTRETDLLLTAIFLGFMAGVMAFWLFRFRLIVGVFVFLVVFFVVFDRTRPHHKTMVKIFAVSQSDARQVVKNVLNEKGLPYKIYSKGRFVIEDEVEVQVSQFQSREGMRGTAVSLTPKTPESQQLIFSLRQKLDEAFRPRGL